MQDAIIKGTGNSRKLRSVANFMALYPTYEDFAAALVAGTLPVDFNGINPNGWTQLGTPMNKANVLTDETATSMGLTAEATPNDAFSKIKSLTDLANLNANTRAHIATGSYTGTGTYGASNPCRLTFDFIPVLLVISVEDIPAYNSGVIMCKVGGFTTGGISGAISIHSAVTGKTVRWSSVDPTNQLNMKNSVYHYVCIG